MQAAALTLPVRLNTILDGARVLVSVPLAPLGLLLVLVIISSISGAAIAPA